MTRREEESDIRARTASRKRKRSTATKEEKKTKMKISENVWVFHTNELEVTPLAVFPYHQPMSDDFAKISRKIKKKFNVILVCMDFSYNPIFDQF